MKREEVEKKDRVIAGVLSGVIFTAVLVLCFFLVAFRIQDPPPGEQFVAIGMADFGSDLSAGGDTESQNPSDTPQDDQAESSSQQTESSATTDVATQNASDVSVNSSTKPNKDPKKPKEDPKPTVSDGLNNILNQINKGGGGGSDGENDGKGNEGNQNGDISGKGVVQGKGIGWSLAGRGMIGEPKLSESPKEEGTVVLDIYVDKSGKVTRTKRNISASTTSSNYLFQLAEKAALTATFTVKNDAPVEQTGQMTFRFKLK